MKIKTNKIFDRYLKQLDIDFKTVDFAIPQKLSKLISGEILEQNDCITMTTLTNEKNPFPKTLVDKTGTESLINHFHVEDYLKTADKENLRKIISAGLTTLKLLVEKFQNAGKTKLQFVLSFETVELGQQFDKKMKWANDEHYNGCQIRFYKKRKGKRILTEDLNKYEINGIVTIDT
ncbi:MAG: hypothetical protein ABI723_04970 [Bacteroidia bacterium]